MKSEGSLSLTNHQRTKKINTASLRKQLETFLKRELPAVVAEKANRGVHETVRFEIAVQLVDAQKMVEINERWLRHKGSTDVITFDYSIEGSCGRAATASKSKPSDRDRAEILIHGDIFVCVDEAVNTAPRFRTTWKAELVRYILHGILHLIGFDDKTATKKRKMKAVENALVEKFAS